MAETKKSAAAAEKTEEQAKLDILTGIIDRDTRMYTMQKTVSIDGEKREGTFRFRYPTIADRLKQGILQSRFLGGTSVSSLDIVTYNIAYSMAFLASIAEQLPAWFKFENMESVDELQEMFVEVTEFVNSFRGGDEEHSDAEGGKNTTGKKAVANS